MYTNIVEPTNYTFNGYFEKILGECLPRDITANVWHHYALFAGDGSSQINLYLGGEVQRVVVPHSIIHWNWKVRKQWFTDLINAEVVVLRRKQRLWYKAKKAFCKIFNLKF